MILLPICSLLVVMMQLLMRCAQQPLSIVFFTFPFYHFCKSFIFRSSLLLLSFVLILLNGKLSSSLIRLTRRVFFHWCSVSRRRCAVSKFVSILLGWQIWWIESTLSFVLSNCVILFDGICSITNINLIVFWVVWWLVYRFFTSSMFVYLMLMVMVIGDDTGDFIRSSELGIGIESTTRPIILF